jgi:hypothetical protein
MWYAIASGYKNGGSMPPSPSSPPTPSNDSPVTEAHPLQLNGLEQIIPALWEPLKIKVDAKSFLNKDGEEYKLPAGELLFKKPMGKQICILDVDTRPMDAQGELFNETAPTWENLHRLAGGILSHYLYALIHGYDYKFIRSPDYKDRQGGWTKVVMTQEMMKTHEIVLMIDSDAEFRNPELPLEWLMNYWQITPDVSIAMAADPAGDPNFDSKGNVMLNTGFNINQAKAPRTDELYKVWAECPEEKIFKGCAKWKYEGFREQTAFSEHVRYNFQDDNTIKVLPCDEANGAPDAAQSGCTGRFVRHYWINKDFAKREFRDGVMQAMVPLLTTSFQHSLLDLSHKKLSGAEILD